MRSSRRGVALGCWCLMLTLSLVAAHGNHGNQAGQPQPTDFSDPNIIKNEEHMKEHMKNEINTDKEMSQEEMEFHYFRLHDTNNDTHLDGLEILAALNHMMPPMDFLPQELQGKTQEQVTQMRQHRQTEMFNNYVNIIDKVLINDDMNNDGYLSYTEYIIARRRDTRKLQEAQKRMMQEASRMQQQQFQEFQKFQQQQQNAQGGTQHVNQGQQIAGQGQKFQGQGQPMQGQPVQGQPMQGQGQQFQQAPSPQHRETL